MLDQSLTFNRANIANSYCDSLIGKGIANATSGLFLAGPRRVGKSTFLMEDLIPEAQNRNWLPIYIDLWASKLTDPASLIIEAIKVAIATQKSGFRKLASRIRLSKINILKILEIDFSKPGLPENITLTDLLSGLIKLARKPVLLIIDEAQHTLTTQNGIMAMFSIKSARDQINTSHSPPELMLVLTGSNRDKLAQLVIKKDQPFFGSEVTPFPFLGRDFTDFFTDHVNKALVSNNQFSKENMWEVFQLIGYRPEILRQIVGRVAINYEAQNFSELLKKDASLWQTQFWQEFANDFNLLSSLQRSILTLLIKQGRTWSPFSEESICYYRNATAQPTLTIPTVQTAINFLRENGFIWQSSRGAYALEDESFAEWFRRHVLLE